MARALSVSRATVSRENLPAYLAALGALAVSLQARGQSVWLFRHPTLRDSFLEFSESASPETHRSRAPRDPAEAALELRLRGLAAYADDAGTLWEAVPMQKG
jgi:hypothetical protein